MREIWILSSVLLSGCGAEVEKPGTGKVVLRGPAMGTNWSVVIPDGERIPEGVRDTVAGIIGEVELAMSTWVDDSEVSRFNRLGAGVEMGISEELAEVVGCGLGVWEKSGGAFDITAGSVVDGGSKWLVLDEEKGTLAKSRDGISIDLSAIAKGYAVDKVAEGLDELGVENFLVEIGGELRGKGVAGDGKPWRVGVERPVAGGKELSGTVELSGMSVATSGNYRQPRHLIDPGSGGAVEREPMAVCVLNESAMVADAWATAFFVLGVERGRRLAEELGIRVAFVENAGGLNFDPPKKPDGR